MKIVDSVSYNIAIPMFIDLNKFVSINGQIYTKELSPIPFNFFPSVNNDCWSGSANSYNVSPTSGKYTIKKNPVSDSIGSHSQSFKCEINQKRRTSIVDVNDDNVVYNISSNGTNNYMILKSTVSDNGLVHTRNTSLNSSFSSVTFVGQSNTHLFVCCVEWTAQYPGHDRPYNVYYVSIRKSDLSFYRKRVYESTSTYSQSDFIQFSVIYEDDKFIYINASGGQTKMHNIFFKIDKLSLDFVLLFTDKNDNSSKGIATQSSSGIRKDNKIISFYGMCEDVSAVKSEHPIEFRLKRFIIDEYTLESKVENIGAFIPIYKDYDRLKVMRVLTTISNDNVYVTFIPCDRAAYSSLDEADKYITTFKVSSDLNLVETGKTKIENTQIYIDFFDRNSGNHLTLVTPHNVDFYIFDNSSEKFVLKNNISVDMRECMIDHHDRLWIRDISHNLELYNEMLPTDIKAEFANRQYAYEGYTINTNVIVSAKNFNNENVEVDVRLTLIGDCHFENGKKEMDVKTLSSGDLQIPVSVVGSGQITVSSRIIE